MNIAARLLWIDCSAGAMAGLIVLLLHNWLSELYGLPLGFTLFLGAANLSYGVFSFTLARQQQPSYLQFKVLVVANILWAALCLLFVSWFWGDASVFGIAQLILESIFVGGLGMVEWRYRDHLNLRTGGSF